MLCDAVRSAGRDGDVHVVLDDDALVVVAHMPTGALGHLLVVTRRHASYVADLTDEEATAVGRAVGTAARALRAEFDPEYVHSAIIGTGVAHFHQHLSVRHRGTPAEVAWHEVDEWEGAPRAVTLRSRRCAPDFTPTSCPTADRRRAARRCVVWSDPTGPRTAALPDRTYRGGQRTASARA